MHRNDGKPFESIAAWLKVAEIMGNIVHLSWGLITENPKLGHFPQYFCIA